MPTWSHPPQLVRFEALLAQARAHPETVSDRALVEQVRATYWGANCWSWVEMSLAIVSAVCAARPHLAVELIEEPIGAMIEGGLASEDDVVAQGVALARKAEPYVPPTEEGRRWLLERWPLLEAEARAAYRRQHALLTAPDPI